MSAVRFYIKLIEHPREHDQDINWEWQLYDRQQTVADGLRGSGLRETPLEALDAALKLKTYLHMSETAQW